jgi:5,10-methylenetetrahydromethanopterin reductase
MDFGIAIPTWSDCWKLVRRAEALGAASAWFFDTQLLNADIYIAMGLAAANTRKIRLGTGVVVPSNRIAPVTAAALATLNALAPGRIDFGVGTGYTARRTMGLEPVTRAQMKEYIRVVMALLSRETVEWEIEDARRKIRFLNPETGLINTTDPIGLHISGLGPKTRQLTADLGAGWINIVSRSESAAVDLADMQRAWSAAGRSGQALYSTALVAGAVLRPGETCDAPLARAQAGPAAAVQLHALVERGDVHETAVRLPPHLREVVDRYHEAYLSYEPADARYLTLHRGHLMFLRPEEEALITAEFIRDTTFTASEDELVERFRDLRRAGYSQIAVQVPPGQEGAVEDWARVFERL